MVHFPEDAGGSEEPRGVLVEAITEVEEEPVLAEEEVALHLTQPETQSKAQLLAQKICIFIAYSSWSFAFNILFIFFF